MFKLWWWSFLKTLKILCRFQNSINFEENVDGFEDNCVWSYGTNFCQLWQECMWTAVKVLKTGPKISDCTKRCHKQLSLFDINGKLA